MSSTDLDTLRKVLALERQKGHKDTAVVGGLDRFLARWGERSPGESPLKPLRGGYARTSLATRKRWLDESLTLLDGGTAPLAAVPKKPRTRTAPGKARTEPPTLQSPVTVLPRVTANTATKLGRLGVNTVHDLLYLLPRRHNDFGHMRKVSQLEADVEQTVMVSVWEAREVQLGKRTRATEAVVGDETGNLRVVWFNQPYLARKLPPGTRLVLSGRVSVYRGTAVMESPEQEVVRDGEDLIHTGRLVPVYPLTEGLTPRSVRTLVRGALDTWLPLVTDPVPAEVRRRAELPDLTAALFQSHYPDDVEAQEKARRRLAFDELFKMQLYVFSRRREWRDAGGALRVVGGRQLVDAFLARLPFPLTGAQARTLGEVLGDMESDKPMSRLLQGEVGSGKTVVALAALLAAAADGYQGAFMAPTEILAQQHFRSISTLLGGLPRPVDNAHWFSVDMPPLSKPLSVGLLIGGQSAKQKREVQQMVARGELDMVVGTHALAQRDVEAPRLALAVVDEQHRFGVMQRASLRQKGGTPHLLVMSATPIPRSLALTLYGDLDLSVLDEMPPGRQKVKTSRVYEDRRMGAYGFLRAQVKEGRQAFVICPLIDESDTLQTRAATTEFERLSAEVFPDLSLGLLHGRMSLRDKEAVMERFYRGEVDILVSTPVVEVGIDNPNATVMLIGGAERFGLAQLHQFRGRVGRGQYPSYCLLLSDSRSPVAIERLRVLERVDNGFKVAEEDLKFRGPGDFFGTRQSGLPELRQARLSDHDILAAARREATLLLNDDPKLEAPGHAALALELARYASASPGDVS